MATYDYNQLPLDAGQRAALIAAAGEAAQALPDNPATVTLGAGGDDITNVPTS